jgi:glycosyltransferase involved in cell wall biosynthesis
MGPWFPVPAVSGGSVHRFWQGIAENFASKGHKVTILSKLWVNQPSHEVLAKVEYIRCRGFTQSKFLLFNIIKDFIYSFSFANKLPDADILIVNDLCLPFFAKENNGKLIININRIPKGQLRLYPKRSQFIAASCLIKDVIEKDSTIDFSRVKVIPNPISVETFSPKFSEKRTNKIILYVGRIHPEKGLLILINAFKVIRNKFPNTFLKIVGPYGEMHGGFGKRYLNYLKNQCKGLNIEFYNAREKLDHFLGHPKMKNAV